MLLHFFFLDIGDYIIVPYHKFSVNIVILLLLLLFDLYNISYAWTFDVIANKNIHFFLGKVKISKFQKI
jgi:hypothetical protein